MTNKNSNIEKLAVKKFLENENIKFDGSLITIPNQDDYVDIIYNNVEYQVTGAPAGYLEVEGRLSKETEVVSKQNNNIEGKRELIGGLNANVITHKYTNDEVWKDYVFYPISNKQKQYVKIPNTEKLTLLIFCAIDPPFEWLEQFKSAISQDPNHPYYQFLEKLGFEAIYLVLSNKNFLLFSLKYSE